MSFESSEQALIRAIVERTDRQAALDVSSGVLHPGTALAIFDIIREVVRPLDPKLADLLVARATKDAASRVAAAQVEKNLNAEGAEAQRIPGDERGGWA